MNFLIRQQGQFQNPSQKTKIYANTFKNDLRNVTSTYINVQTQKT